MQDFLDQMKATLMGEDYNVSVTENGAVGYKTTGKALLDMNFMVSSMRSMSVKGVEALFSAACSEDLKAAVVWLFFARDREQGMGERRMFRICLRYLAREFPDIIRKCLLFVPFYGRWDDLWCLLDTRLKTDVLELTKRQLTDDMKAVVHEQPISMLAKWMPSLNTSSKDTRNNAEIIRSHLGLSPKYYRKILTRLRSRLNIVETSMSSGEWDKINYSAVPSRANLIYNDAFLRHDEQRRREYLGKVEKGDEKINASVLFPHDVLHKYTDGFNIASREDPAVEAMWKALPDMTAGKETCGTIVVADGSGSMTAHIGTTNISALEVANALAIYFAERLNGPFRDKYITFSLSPQLVDLGGASTLLGKLNIAMEHDEVANTDIMKVFMLILETALHSRLPQDQMPSNILIISDMEFDMATVTHQEHLFEDIRKKFESAGYKLPRLVFWNVMNRSATIPMRQNSLGVALVSGFSPNIARMVFSGELDPYKNLMETLNSARYTQIREAIA